MLRHLTQEAATRAEVVVERLKKWMIVTTTSETIRTGFIIRKTVETHLSFSSFGVKTNNKIENGN